MTLCIYSCRGALSTLFITSPDWNWSLRLWATGKKMDLIRCWGAASMLCCHLKAHRLFIYSSKDSLMWCWRGDAKIMLCLILWAQRQIVAPTHDPVLVYWGCTCLQYVHTALLDTHAVIAFLCYNVLMELYILLASPWTSCQGLRQILT